MTAYYNEIDPYAAQWLRNLIAAGLIAPGDVDEQSIEDVTPYDLIGYTQRHFFAGIGVWSLALRRAGWPDSRPAWTGSCPCQPFSSAGKGVGFDDERHLWPAFYHLISECRPTVVFGEQVASKYANAWLDLVHTDLGAVGYAFGAVAFPSASVGAPHRRDRTYWVGNSKQSGLERYARHDGATRWEGPRGSIAKAGCQGSVDNSIGDGWGKKRDDNAKHDRLISLPANEISRLEHPNLSNHHEWSSSGEQSIYRSRPDALILEYAESEQERVSRFARERGATRGPWSAADWIPCRDGYWRPVQPGTFPLAHGVTNRMGKIRAYGNAVNSYQAQIFIESTLNV